MHSEERPMTLPFRPHISVDPAIGVVDEFFLDTGMVIVAPTPPMTGAQFYGADKVELYVAFAASLSRQYTIAGEFICGGVDETGGEACIGLYGGNDLSDQLRGLCIRVPIQFVGRVLTRVVADGDRSPHSE